LNQKFQHLILILKEKLGLYTALSLGVFLFVLFFEPFPVRFQELNDSLIFNSGFGGIVFILLISFSTLFPKLSQSTDSGDEVNEVLTYFSGFIILVLSSAAFAFYLRYVGRAEITFYIMFRIVLICLVPPVVLRLYSLRTKSSYENKLLLQENTSMKKQLDKIEEDSLNVTLEFVSENNAENSKLQLSTIAYIKSADNYVEIYHWDEDILKKILLRNTLKNIEMQVKPYSNFVRCHRTCIVNSKHIQKLNRQINNWWLTILNSDEKIPVSRQYIITLKEAISSR